ncbi:hypothetical protein BRCON_2087 [Candidatus Sumerlaea chitinivorans]|uniref:Uncharacterized protein n=1 Tax=Sumerlaea chitinivorans TaxID=2250252 RepID=A0A2Z4Y6N2_SUMC1|nr:hypothetical protein BRCON_2087 [Candidatus Sumerlaea chitinivorans]
MIAREGNAHSKAILTRRREEREREERVAPQHPLAHLLIFFAFFASSRLRASLC